MVSIHTTCRRSAARNVGDRLSPDGAAEFPTAPDHPIDLRHQASARADEALRISENPRPPPSSACPSRTATTRSVPSTNGWPESSRVPGSSCSNRTTNGTSGTTWPRSPQSSPRSGARREPPWAWSTR
jgi:hypothetical protein